MRVANPFDHPDAWEPDEAEVARCECCGTLLDFEAGDPEAPPLCSDCRVEEGEAEGDAEREAEENGEK